MIKDLHGRVAFITGAASGIGLGLARVLGRRGMKLALADIETVALRRAAEELEREGIEVLALTVDVANSEAVVRAAATATERFGGVHLLCNNAGVGLEGPVETWTDEGWAWVLGVNVMGVVNGVRALTPILRGNPDGGHILNVASIGGVTAAPHHGQYAASKFAVVGLSQSLRDELAPHGIGVSVLCPGFVRSSIASSARNAPELLQARQDWLMHGGFEGPAAELFATIERRTADAMDPEAVAEIAMQGILDNELYVFTEVEFADAVERRLGQMRRGLDAIHARVAGERAAS